MILRIRLKNWTSHKDTELEFGNANIFLGVIGSGKSSVVEAISYALFGVFPDLQSRNLNLGDIIRSGESKAYVELELEVKGKRVKVVRTIERDGKSAKSTAKLYIDSRLITESPTQVNNYLENLLELDFTTFSNTLYSSQNRLDSLLSLPPSEKRRLLDELINIYRLEKALKNSTSLINRIQRLIKENRNQLQQIDIKEAEDRKKEIEKEIEELNKNVLEKKELHQSILNKFNIKRKEYEELNQRRKLIKELEEKRAKVLGVINSLEEYEKKEVGDEEELWNKKKDLENRLKEIEEEIKKHKKRLTELITEISSYKQKLSRAERVEKEIKELEEKLTQISIENIEDLEREKEELIKESSSINSILNQLKESLEGIEKATSKCPVCLKPLNEEEKLRIREHIKEEIEKNSKRLEELKQRYKDLVRRIEENKKKEKIKKDLESKLNYLTSEKVDREELLEKIKGLEKEKEKQEENLNVLDSSRKELLERIKDINLEIKTIKEIKEKKERLKRAREMLKEVEERLKTTEFSEEEFERVLEELRRLEGEKEKLYSFINQTTKLIEEKKNLLKEIEKRINLYLSISKRIERLSSLLEDLSKIREVIQVVQLEARKNLLDAINMSLNSIWRVVYPYEDYTEVKIEARDNSYSFLVFNGQEWKELERVASGGERTLFVLSLRLAISSVLMNKLDFIVLDEPTHNLDDQAVNRLGELINKELSSIANQFFIITHDERLKNIERGKVFYFERTKKGNEPTSVKEI